MKRDRRQFLRGGPLVLGAVTAGSIRSPESETAAAASGRRCAWFGWELNLNNNDGAVYFQLQTDLTLESVDVDLAYTITTLPESARFSEVLCLGGVLRGSGPNFSDFVFNSNVSSDFGEVLPRNPQNLFGFDHVLFQDVFYSVILKTWVPRDGTGSATYRNTHTEPRLNLAAGDYLVFTMGGDGPAADVEMQIVLGYSLPSTRVVSFR